MDYTTVHDWKPSHNPKPANLVELEYAAQKAWWDHDALVEARLDYWAGIRKDEVTHEQIQAAQDAAVQAQQAYYDAWYEANSDQCSCKPNSAIVCDVCRALYNRKANERIIENV